MNDGSTGYLFLCLLCGLPYVAGIISTVVVITRLSRYGLPWALIPFGGTFKKLFEEKND